MHACLVSEAMAHLQIQKALVVWRVGANVSSLYGAYLAEY